MKNDKIISEFLEEFDNMSLEERIKLSLTMGDYNNWEDGIYKGDWNTINRQTSMIIQDVSDWMESPNAPLEQKK